MGAKYFAALFAVAAAIAVTALAPEAYAQRAGQQNQESQANQPARRTPAMRERVYQRLAEAQECSEDEDMVCARRLLDQVREMTDLNSYEVAQMWNFYAFINFSDDNFPEAIAAYENVLQQEELPIGLETTTMYSLATLYVQQELYQQGLDMLERWLALSDAPSPGPYILKAQIHYALEQFREGIEPVLTALEIAEQQGRSPQEGWYQLLNVFYFEIEDYPKVIETLTTLVETWPKKDYLVQLAGIYGQEGEDNAQLALYEAAHEVSWLDRSTERVTLAQMLMQADIPYKAARILQDGLDSGDIESTEPNWRLLSQAWQLAQEDEAALPALLRASNLADDGNLDHRLAQSYANLARWDECVEAARDAVRRGGLNREDQANLLLGNCLVELKEYDEARNAFQAASRDERSRSGAQQWLEYVRNEQRRDAEIARALRRG
ncbi:tetratricopeptide repeat protein [Candidatus Rariloculus sp.]|uniref:tetratricopeptide repeat protein n=1 Tax=Candidatus Rariloculus sp. TaxID=3101265 RepID=UPI003D09BBB4